MKETSIGIVLKGYPRLSETFISQEIFLLEKKGFQFEIFSMRKAREKVCHPIVEKIKAPVTYLPEYLSDDFKGFSYALLKYFSHSPILFFKYLGHAIISSVLNLSFSTIKRFCQACWLIERNGLKKERINHLHSHFVHSPTELTFYISKLSNISYSITAHAKDIYTSPKKILKERIDNCEFLMTCTQFNVDYLNQNINDISSKVHTVLHGINSSLFVPGEKKFSESGNCTRLITCARLVPKKGYDLIFYALASLRDQGYSFSYDIYGEGELREYLEEKIKFLNLASEIKIHGNITQPELIEEYAKQGIFILACRELSNGDRDGIPNSLAEAMSMEMPVIATNVSGIPELVENGKSGLLVETENTVDLAFAIKRIFDDPFLGDVLGLAARERVLNIFEADSCIEKCSELLGPFKH